MGVPPAVLRASVLVWTAIGSLALLRAQTPEAVTPWESRAGIGAHLARVEGDLRAVDTSNWDAEVARRRAFALDRLHEYWQRGVFPHNEGISREPLPIFIDAHDHACAVGHLMIASGAEPLARRIAAAENYDDVADIDTPGVAQWAADNGLGLDELARIQPSYGDFEPDCTNLECYCKLDYLTTIAVPELPDPSEYAYAGPCRCDGCPDDTQWQMGDPWSPGEVCGEDEVTYPNACAATLCGQVDVDRLGPCSHASPDPEDEGCSCRAVPRSSPLLWLLLLPLVRRRRGECGRLG